MVSELRWKPAVASGAVQHCAADHKAGGTETGFDPRLSTAFAERGSWSSPGAPEASTGLLAWKSKEAMG
jgi:hypothetical protein